MAATIRLRNAIAIALGGVVALTHLAACQPKVRLPPDAPDLAFFASTSHGYTSDVFLVKSRSQRAKVLVAVDSYVGPSLSWSPTGNRLLFIRREPPLKQGVSQLVSLDVTDYTTETLVADIRGIRAAKWSPDGESILVLAGKPEGSLAGVGLNSSVYVVAADGQVLYDVGSALAMDWISDIAWAPGLGGILLAGSVSGRIGLHVVGMDSSRQPELIKYRDVPCISVDVHELSIVCSMDPDIGTAWGGDRDLVLIHDWTGRAEFLTERNGIDDDRPSWSDDGKLIAFEEHSDSRESEAIDIVVLETRTIMRTGISGDLLNEGRFYSSPVFRPRSSGHD